MSADNEAQRLNLLETLVEELLKDQPRESLVSECFDQVGLPDSKDPIDRINKVLLALNFEQPQRKIKE